MPCPNAGLPLPGCWHWATTPRARLINRSLPPRSSASHRSSKSSASSCAQASSAGTRGCRTLQRCNEAPYPIEKLFGAQLFSSPIDQEAERERSRPLDVANGGAAGYQPFQSSPQPALLQLFLQHFAMGLKEEQVLGIVAGEHIVEEPARRLDLLHALV